MLVNALVDKTEVQVWLGGAQNQAQKVKKASKSREKFQNVQISGGLAQNIAFFGCKSEHFWKKAKICFRLGRNFIKSAQNPPLLLYERRLLVERLVVSTSDYVQPLVQWLIGKLSTQAELLNGIVLVVG